MDKDIISIRKSASIEHQNLVEMANNLFKGKMVAIRGNSTIKGNYYPDIISDNINIECELIKNNILQKIKKGNNGKEKILVIGYPKYVLDFFKEIYIHDIHKNILIKVK